MNMKVRKSVIAFLMATTMVGSTAVPAMADTATVNVSIKTTGLTGKNQSTANYILPATSVTVSKEGDAKVTAMDALLQVAGEGSREDITRNINGTNRTYHRQGLLEWYKSQYGNYISAIKLDGHNNSNKYFNNNGSDASHGDYFKLAKLNMTEKRLGLNTNSTWNNTVHFENYLSEKDYNNYSGWMCLINNESPYTGVDTVLKDGDVLVMDYSMMMGLDLGLDSYMENADGEWVQVSGWK